MRSRLMSRLSRSLRGVRGLIGGSRAYISESYSQEGEDILLARIFNDGKAGFYVDVGAHHPFRFSNTYAFYLRGWRGVNVDPRPGSMRLFRRYRPHDTNLEMGVAESRQSLTYHMFREPALNTFSDSVAAFQATQGRPSLSTIEVECAPLCEILRTCRVSLDGRNSFLTVDVEGLDLAVLRSNDWDVFRPSVIVAEISGRSLREVDESDVATYLGSHGYSAFSKLGHSAFFKRADFEIL